MNKKANTVFFLVAATVVNLLILLLSTVVLTSFFIVLYRNVGISVTLSWIAVIVILFGSIIFTFLVYSRLLRWVTRKWKLDSYLEPLFGSRHLH